MPSSSALSEENNNLCLMVALRIKMALGDIGSSSRH
jgi:hypothetical protein